MLQDIDLSNKNAAEAKDYLVEEISRLVEEGNPEIALQLLDIMGLSSDSALRMVGTIRSIQDNVKDYTDSEGKKVLDKKGKPIGKALEYEHTPSITTLREKIKAEMQKRQGITSFKKNLRAILDSSFVDIIGKNEARKLDELGRRTSGEGLSRYDGIIKPKNLIMVEAGPQELVNEEKQTTEDNA